MYPWMADIAYRSPDGTLTSTVAGGSMSLALSDNVVLCLVGRPQASLYTSAFSANVSITFSLATVVLPCVVNDSLTTASMVCCRAPSVADLCGSSTNAECMTRGEGPVAVSNTRRLCPPRATFVAWGSHTHETTVPAPGF